MVLVGGFGLGECSVDVVEDGGREFAEVVVDVADVLGSVLVGVPEGFVAGVAEGEVWLLWAVAVEGGAAVSHGAGSSG